MRKLDFIIIGAQKAGTTAMHMYLKDNSNIYMPPEKEAIFFSDNERYERGYDWYVQEFFNEALSPQIWGKATPAYSCYPKVSSERIRKHNDNIKIIYILRDPIERAISQYKMNRKRGVEVREFSEIINTYIPSKSGDYSEGELTECNSYFEWGQYASVLDHYKWVKKGHLCLLSDKLLNDDTAKAVSYVSEFLGIDYFDTPLISKKFHVAGVRKYKIIDKLRSLFFLKFLWRRLVPFKYRRRISFWLDQWNTKQSIDDDVILTNKERDTLRNYFYEEFKLISSVDEEGGFLIK